MRSRVCIGHTKTAGVLVGVHIRHAHTSDDGVGHTDDPPNPRTHHIFWITDVMDQGHQTVKATRYTLWEYGRKSWITAPDWEKWSDATLP